VVSEFKILNESSIPARGENHQYQVIAEMLS